MSDTKVKDVYMIFHLIFTIHKMDIYCSPHFMNKEMWDIKSEYNFVQGLIYNVYLDAWPENVQGLYLILVLKALCGTRI